MGHGLGRELDAVHRGRLRHDAGENLLPEQSADRNLHRRFEDTEPEHVAGGFRDGLPQAVFLDQRRELGGLGGELLVGHRAPGALDAVQIGRLADIAGEHIRRHAIGRVA